MSIRGLLAARKFGVNLPSFASQQEAERELLALRDRSLQQLLRWAAKDSGTALDYSVESLRRLEAWYFETGRSRRQVMAQACAFYFGEVVVRNRPGARWVVSAFPFTQGKYEIGVEEGLGTMMLMSFEAKLEHHLNREHDSLWRTYEHYFARNPKVIITF